jgi:uncharacterized membrane protein YcaP (DUF421 family)
METHLLSVWHDLVRLGSPEMTNDWAHWLEKLLRPAAVYLFLVFMLRRFGRRMLAQLNPFDFVVLLTLSNTVQNAIIGEDTSLLGGLVGAAALLALNALLVRHYYRGPSQDRLSDSDRDVPLIHGGRLAEHELRRFHINAGELVAKAHERGFDTLGEVDSAMLYPNGTIYFRGRHPDDSEQRHRALMERLDHLQRELASLRASR